MITKELYGKKFNPKLKENIKKAPLLGAAILTGQIALIEIAHAGAASIESDVVTLTEVEVTAEVESETAYSPVDGYAASRSASGTKTDTPIIETPASVQVIPRDVIDQQKAINIKDVYENVSGVQQAGNTLNAQSEVLPIIRGFESPTLLRNGLRATAAGAVDLINIERVEVLKGPASILYGALEPGGVVNYVTKRPQAESNHQFMQTFGSYNFRQTAIDSTGKVNDAGTFMYRFNAARTDSDSFRDEIELERTSIAPSLLWKPDENTELLIDFSYTKEEQPYDSGIPLSEKGKPLVSDSTFFGDSDLKGRKNEDYYASYQFTRIINPTWTVRNQFQFHRADNSNESIRNRGVASNDTLLRQRYQNEERVEDEAQFVLDGIATFNTGSVSHKLLLGVEHIKQVTDWRRARQNLANVSISNDPIVNFNPPANQVLSDEPSETKWWALYFQDQMSFLEDGRLKVLWGGRFDDVVTKSSQNNIDNADVNDNAFTGRAGILYMLNNESSIYMSSSQSFRPQQGSTLDVNGSPLDPETGNQIELGYKNSLWGGSLTSTVSLYQIEKENVAVFNQALFNATGQQSFFPGVKQRSRGLEIDVAGRITEQLNLLANYSYTDTEVLENEGDITQEGEPFGGVSRNLARLWLTYDFKGELQGLGIGGGVRYVGKTTAQFDRNIPIDAYTVADLGAWYSWKNMRAGLKLNNLFDKEYIARASDASIAHFGTPRSVFVDFSINF